MPKKIKTKYTLRSDGRICRTEIIDGKRKFFYGHSDAEVDAKYDAYVGEKETKKKKGRSFDVVAEEWWSAFERKLSPNSVMTYLGAKNRAVEHFKGKGIKDISSRDIYAYLSDFAAQDLSQKVVARHKAVLKAIFDYAFIQEDVDLNPCVGIPKVKCKEKTEREPAGDKDIELIEKYKNEDNFGQMMYFMLYTGARRGEAAALQYKNLDRVNGTARIVQSVAFGPSGKPELKSPKSASGKRDLIVPKRVLEVIPECDDGERFVFFPDGLPGQHDLERGLKRFQDSHGISATAHQLRHSYASMLHSAGIDAKDAQHLLGHSRIELTQDIYTSIEKKHSDELKEIVNQKLSER